MLQSDTEHQNTEFLAQLRNGSCKGKNDAAAMNYAISSLASSGDRRAVGDLLRIAKQGNKCSTEALAAARTLIGTKRLSLEGEDERIIKLRTIPCDGRWNTNHIRKQIGSLVKDKQTEAVGDLLKIASGKHGCATEALLAVQAILGNTALSLE